MRIARVLAVGVVFASLALSGCAAAGAPPKGTATSAEKTTEEAITVPGVVGQQRSAARVVIQNRGLAAVDGNVAPTGDDPIVVGQQPAEGVSVNPGTVVQLIFEIPTPTPTAVAAPPVAPAPSTVVYQVIGANVDRASITYTVPNGSFAQEQAADAGLPWSKEIPITGANNYYGLVAQGNGGGGSISCVITVNGRQISNQTSNGAYAVVQCSG